MATWNASEVTGSDFADTKTSRMNADAADSSIGSGAEGGGDVSGSNMSAGDMGMSSAGGEAGDSGNSGTNADSTAGIDATLPLSAEEGGNQPTEEEGTIPAEGAQLSAEGEQADDGAAHQQDESSASAAIDSDKALPAEAGGYQPTEEEGTIPAEGVTHHVAGEDEGEYSREPEQEKQVADIKAEDQTAGEGSGNAGPNIHISSGGDEQNLADAKDDQQQQQSTWADVVADGGSGEEDKTGSLSSETKSEDAGQPAAASEEGSKSGDVGISEGAEGNKANEGTDIAEGSKAEEAQPALDDSSKAESADIAEGNKAEEVPVSNEGNQNEDSSKAEEAQPAVDDSSKAEEAQSAVDDSSKAESVDISEGSKAEEAQPAVDDSSKAEEAQPALDDSKIEEAQPALDDSSKAESVDISEGSKADEAQPSVDDSGKAEEAQSAATEVPVTDESNKAEEVPVSNEGNQNEDSSKAEGTDISEVAPAAGADESGSGSGAVGGETHQDQGAELGEEGSAASASGEAAAAGAGTGSASATDSIKELLSSEFSDSKTAQAALYGNIVVETGGKLDYTTKQQGGGPGRGLFQMEGQMREWYDAWRGSREDSAEAQIQFVKHELSTGEHIGQGNASKIREAFAGGDVEHATRVFCEKFERPGEPHMERRVEAANTFLGEGN